MQAGALILQTVNTAMTGWERQRQMILPYFWGRFPDVHRAYIEKAEWGIGVRIAGDLCGACEVKFRGRLRAINGCSGDIFWRGFFHSCGSSIGMKTKIPKQFLEAGQGMNSIKPPGAQQRTYRFP
jgi:hypothetical protein